MWLIIIVNKCESIHNLIFFVKIINIKNIEIIIMINKVLIVLCVSIVFVLGYWAYLDTQNKRHQELMRIIQEAALLHK